MGKSVPTVAIIILMAIATRAAFTGSFPDASPRGAFRELAAAPSGGWSWFADPRARYHAGATWWGYVDGTNGDIQMARLTTDGTLTESVLYPALETPADDHDDPAFLFRRSDGKTLATFSAHFSADIYRAIATGLPVLADVVNIGSQLGSGFYTYPAPVELASDPAGTIRMFVRRHPSALLDPYMAMSVSTDDGHSWGTAQDIVLLTYHKVIETEDRIHFALSNHPVEDAQASIYHIWWEAGTWYGSDGVSLGSPPFDESDLAGSVVYDGSTTPAWVWDIAMDGDEPVIAFATFPGGDGSDHRYRVARRTGGVWGSTEIAAGGTQVATSGAGSAYYSGGIALDRLDPDVSYVSVKVGSEWHIDRYPGAVRLTSSGKNIRPIGVRDAGPIRVLAMTGTYTTYLDYSVGTSGG